MRVLNSGCAKPVWGATVGLILTQANQRGSWQWKGACTVLKYLQLYHASNKLFGANRGEFVPRETSRWFSKRAESRHRPLLFEFFFSILNSFWWPRSLSAPLNPPCSALSDSRCDSPTRLRPRPPRLPRPRPRPPRLLPLRPQPPPRPPPTLRPLRLQVLPQSATQGQTNIINVL